MRHVTGFLLLLLAGMILPSPETFAQSGRDSPFGESSGPRYKVNNTFNKTFDLSKIGGLGREETMAMFEKIWHEYRSKNQLDSAGNFFESESSSTPDTIEAKAHFYVLIKRNPQEITITDKQECPQCRGKGRKYNPATMSYENCDRCDATGKLANVYKSRGETENSQTLFKKIVIFAPNSQEANQAKLELESQD